MRIDRGTIAFYVQVADRPLYFAMEKLAKKRGLPKGKVFTEAIRKYLQEKGIQAK